MNKAIGLTPAMFGLGGGIFFIGYFLFEVPSNLILYRVGARLWIARVMVTWGLVSAASAFVTGPHSFYALRFLLGLAEAGFLSGHHPVPGSLVSCPVPGGGDRRFHGRCTFIDSDWLAYFRSDHGASYLRRP